MESDRLRRADWQVLTIPEHAEAARLIEASHYAQGAPNTSTYRFGLYRTEWSPFRGDLFGVSLWIPPTTGAAATVSDDPHRVLALSRLAVVEGVPTNGASFLLGRSMRAIDRDRWPVLLTYADTRLGHTGAIYRATGWRCLGPVPAGDTWTDAAGRQWGRKRGGRTLRREEMAALGLTACEPAPKLKFVHP